MIPTATIPTRNIPIATTVCREWVKTEKHLLDADEAVCDLLDLRVHHEGGLATVGRSGQLGADKLEV
jgi:hypothetical protein